MSAEQPVHFYALFYDVVDDYAARRVAFRSEHLGLIRKAHEQGDLVLAGAFADPVDGALLVFQTPDRTVVENFARNDPYVINALVTRWEVREWSVVPLD